MMPCLPGVDAAANEESDDDLQIEERELTEVTNAHGRDSLL